MPFPPGDLLNPGIKPTSALEGKFFITELSGKQYIHIYTLDICLFICYLSIRILNIKMEYYSTMRTKEILPIVRIWVTLENMMLSEKSDRERQ